MSGMGSLSAIYFPYIAEIPEKSSHPQARKFSSTRLGIRLGLGAALKSAGRSPNPSRNLGWDGLVKKKAKAAAPKGWICTTDVERQAFEDLTNAQLDALDHPAVKGPIPSRGAMFAKMSGNKDQLIAAKIAEARESQDHALLDKLKGDPRLARFFPRRPGGKKGSSKFPHQQETEDWQARTLVKLIRQLWKQKYGSIKRGEDANPPTAGQIVLRRMEDRYNIKVDPHAVGVKSKNWKRRKK